MFDYFTTWAAGRTATASGAVLYEHRRTQQRAHAVACAATQLPCHRLAFCWPVRCVRVSVCFRVSYPSMSCACVLGCVRDHIAVANQACAHTCSHLVNYYHNAHFHRDSSSATEARGYCAALLFDSNFYPPFFFSSRFPPSLKVYIYIYICIPTGT